MYHLSTIVDYLSESGVVGPIGKVDLRLRYRQQIRVVGLEGRTRPFVGLHIGNFFEPYKVEPTLHFRKKLPTPFGEDCRFELRGIRSSGDYRRVRPVLYGIQ